jgi:hypothetical protein
MLERLVMWGSSPGTALASCQPPARPLPNTVSSSGAMRLLAGDQVKKVPPSLPDPVYRGNFARETTRVQVFTVLRFSDCFEYFLGLLVFRIVSLVQVGLSLYRYFHLDN